MLNGWGGEQGLAYTSYHSKPGTKEWRFDVCSRYTVVCKRKKNTQKKKKSCFFLWDYFWAFVSMTFMWPDETTSLKGFCKCLTPTSVLVPSVRPPLLQIVFAILFQYAYCLQQLYKTLHLTLHNSDPCINFILLSIFPFFFFITAKFCSWWYPPFLCSFEVLVTCFTRLYLSNEFKTD